MSVQTKLYNLEGKDLGEITLPKLFEETPNDILLSQYVRVYLANNRQGTRKSKDRSEVRGKAGKPWKQKGTGRARHGSNKAPSMRGGGNAHAVQPQNFSLKLSKTMKGKALISAYASKKDDCIVLENPVMTEIKTKTLINFLDNVELNDTVLFIVENSDSNFVLSARNIPGVNVVNSALVNAYSILKANKIVIDKAILDTMNGDKLTEKTEEKKKIVKKASAPKKVSSKVTKK